MKITALNLTMVVAKADAASPVAQALKTSKAKIIATPQPLPAVIGQKSTLPGLGKNGLPGSLGVNIQGIGKNGLPGGLGKNGLLGGLGIGRSGGLGISIAGLGKNGLPGSLGKNGGLGRLGLGGFGKNGLGGFGTGLGGFDQDGFGGFGKGGWIGGSRGPNLKTPGSDRMDGDFSFGVFGKGTWDVGSNGFHASGSAGATVGGYGVGVNDRGQPGVATGDARGGDVTSPSDAKAGASKAVGGSSTAGGGAPEGLDWSRGTRTKDSGTTATAPAANAPNTQGPNDLGPTNNDSTAEPKKEDETAVAKNDTTKNNQAGKPNPFAMPNPEDGGGGSPRSRAGLAKSMFFTPNPEDSGGGTPRSHSALISSLVLPNPDDSGGGTPRSVVASVAMKLR